MEPIRIASSLELEKALLGAHEQLNGELVTTLLEFGDGRSVYVGIGGPETQVLIHEPIEDSAWTKEWISIGDSSRDDELDFMFFGHHTPHHGMYVIPWRHALDCVTHYFETSKRLDSLTWFENRF